MPMVTAFKLVVFERYALFEGRAGRAEYWWFFLANFLIGLVIQVLAGVSDALVILSVIYSLALLIPGLAVAVRRLHDTNKSGWWILIALVPLVGSSCSSCSWPPMATRGPTSTATRTPACRPPSDRRSHPRWS